MGESVARTWLSTVAFKTVLPGILDLTGRCFDNEEDVARMQVPQKVLAFFLGCSQLAPNKRPSSPRSRRGSIQLIYTPKFKYGGFVLSLVIIKYRTDLAFTYIYVILARGLKNRQPLQYFRSWDTGAGKRRTASSPQRKKARMLKFKKRKNIWDVKYRTAVERHRSKAVRSRIDALVWTYSVWWRQYTRTYD